MRLILASTSPRRKELLSLLRIPFESIAPGFTEPLRSELSPEDQALFFAKGKAASCAEGSPDAVVLGSDTLVSLDGKVMGKPADAADSAAMLRRLRGRDHLVHTAVAVVHQKGRRREVALETVRVWMQDFSDGDVERYVRTGEWRDKAGAYAIQGLGAEIIASIEGDFTTAVGLPLSRVADMLRRFGIAVPVDVEVVYRERPYPNWARFASEEGARGARREGRDQK